MSWRGRLMNLRMRLLLAFFLVGLIPLGLVSFLLLGVGNQLLLAQSERELEGLATGLAGEIDAYLFGLLNDARVIATLPDIVSMEPARQEPLLRELFQLNYGFAQIVTTDRTGQMLATARPMALRSIGEVPSFQRALNSGEQSWVVSTAVFGEGLDLHIHTPIQRSDGQIVGVVGSPIPLSRMSSAIDRVSVGIAGESFVLGEQGNILFHPYLNTETQPVNYAESIYNAGGSPPLLPGVAHLERGGEPLVAGYAPLTNRFGWTVVVERPLADLVAPARQLRTLAFVGLGGTLSLALVVALYLAQGLADPIAGLASEAASLVPAAEQTAVSDIDIVRRSFEHMQSRLSTQATQLVTYLAALEQSGEGIAVLDVAGRYLFANRRYMELHGYEALTELNGRFWQTAYAPESWQQLQQAVLPRLASQEAWRGELMAQRQDKSWFETAQSLQRLPSGELVLTVRDLSDRKASDEALLRTQKLESIGVLTGGIAHDFNNLLTGMLGHATMAKARLHPESTAHEYVSQVAVAAERAAELTSQLLAYTRETGFVRQPLDLNKLVLENGRLLATAMPRHTDLQLDLQPNLRPIKADRSQIQQLLMNLVINAAEATSSTGGKVTVQTWEQTIDHEARLAVRYGSEALTVGQYVCLRVADTGIGMTPETLDHIFDPFFTTKSKGHGLGLSAILGILRTHAGALQVLTAPGQGSEFLVYLPTTTEAAAMAQMQTKQIPQLSGTILVVDDEEAVRRVAHDILTQVGMRVLLAVNGQQGVELFRAHHGELTAVILDLRMPVMDGRTAYAQMMQIDPSVKVIISSGYSETEVRDYFVSQTDVAFLNKPYRFDGLINIVRQIMNPA